MLVKICGMTNEADALAAAQYGADFVGFILAPSPRSATPQLAATMIAKLPSTTRGVLVLRDTPLDQAVALIEQTNANWVQLHGQEPVVYLRNLHQRCRQIHLIRAWEVADDRSERALRDYVSAATNDGAPIDVVLLDRPKGSDAIDLELARAISKRWPAGAAALWLAGGLTPDTLESAVAGGQFRGVDVARGVESQPGAKDHAAVRRFIAAAGRL